MTGDELDRRLSAMSDEEFDALTVRMRAEVSRVTGKRYEDCSQAEIEGVTAGLLAHTDQTSASCADLGEMAAIMRGHGGDPSRLPPAAAERFAYLAGVTGFQP